VMPRRGRRKRVLIAAHKPLAGDPRFVSQPRGGEKSVGIIRDELSRDYEVITATYKTDDFAELVPDVDVVLTWGRAAPAVVPDCIRTGTPYVMMVRWWRNIAPVPPGNLREREIPNDFYTSKQYLLVNASSVITNNRWSAETIEEIYGVKAEHSYVPILGALRPGGSPDGPVVMVTDGKGLGSERMVYLLAHVFPDMMFVVINAKDAKVYRKKDNIKTTDYVEDMSVVWKSAAALIYPHYGNDVCGTSRVGVEAMQYAVPAIANDRCGICEKGMIPVSAEADAEEWAHMLSDVFADWPSYSSLMIEAFDKYDTDAQLAVYRRAIEKAISERRK